MFKIFFNSLSDKTNQYYIFLDQAIVSASNFLITIIILRFLGLEIFGIFSFFWIFLLLINSLQLSFIISPMLTNSAKQKYSNLQFFYGSVFIQQLIFTISIFIILYIYLKYFSHYHSTYKFNIFNLEFPLVVVSTQLHQFLRRFLFSKKLFLRALLTDLITYLSLILVMVYFIYLNQFNLESIFLSFIVAFSLGSIINFSFIFSLKYNLKNIYQTTINNWIIAKWLLLTSILQWFAGNLWLLNAGIILGPYYLGIIRACQNLLSVTNIFFQSFENFTSIQSSQKFIEEGLDQMRVYLKEFTFKFFILIMIITLFIVLSSKFLLNIFYGGETAGYYHLLILLSLIIPIHFLQYAPTYGLRTLDHTRPIFIAYLFASIFAILFSKLVITHFEINGLIFGLYLSQTIIVSFLYYGYLNKIKKIKKNKY